MSDYCIDCAMPQIVCKTCSFKPSLHNLLKDSNNKVLNLCLENVNSRLKFEPKKIIICCTPNPANKFFEV